MLSFLSVIHLYLLASFSRIHNVLIITLVMFISREIDLENCDRAEKSRSQQRKRAFTWFLLHVLHNLEALRQHQRYSATLNLSAEKLFERDYQEVSERFWTLVAIPDPSCPDITHVITNNWNSQHITKLKLQYSKGPAKDQKACQKFHRQIWEI